MSGPKLNFSGKEYLLSSLSAEALAKCDQIRYCDERIAQIQTELAVLQSARQAAIQALLPLLPEPVTEPVPLAGSAQVH
jgi:hypothetical protein